MLRVVSPIKFSASLLKVWMNCQQQAEFQEILKRPRRMHAKASFGTCIHDALEQYNWHGDVEKAKARFEYTWSNPGYLGVTPDVWAKQQFGTLMDRGLKIIQEYHDKQAWEPREVIATEHKFCVPFGDHIISGAVDLLEFKLSGRGVPTLKIVDYKTNAKQPTLNELRFDIQFTVYYYASLQPEFWLGWEPEINKYRPMGGTPEKGAELWERFKDAPRRPSWYHLWGNKEIDAGDRDDGDFMRLYRCLEAVNKAVEHGIYIPSIKAESCLWCDFKEECEAVQPIFHKLEVKPGGDGDDAMF